MYFEFEKLDVYRVSLVSWRQRMTWLKHCQRIGPAASHRRDADLDDHIDFREDPHNPATTTVTGSGSG